ncbi:hypothetical protein BJV78DRAFT_1282505 [Lactifluus subvellereus]|nr:hypothetical protein BJV78DRAFT_1282505 [Lactifluus subvellereus]
MIERHLNNAPATLARQPTLPSMYPNTSYGNGYGVTQYTQTSFSPVPRRSPSSLQTCVPSPPAGLQHKSSPLVTCSPVQAEPAKRPDTVYDEDAYGGI